MNLDDLEPHLAANRRYWTSWEPGVDPDSALPIYRTDIEHVLFNGVMRILNRPLPEAIAEARRRLDGARWGWWVGPDSDEGTAEGLLAHGAEQVGDMPIMGIDVRAVRAFDPPAGLKIERVRGREQTAEYVRAYSGPLGFTGDQQPVAAREDQLDLIRLAGVLDGRIVGTCTLSLATEVGALYAIATDLGYQRRGIATALTVEALRLTRESGRHFATLQASSQGEPVYRRVGFETVARYRMFRLP